MGRRHCWALLAWVLVGAGLRLWDLDAKTPWSDEWATLVFSLGRSFQTIPLDQLLSLDELLAIARLDNASTWDGLGNVWQYLMTESTHPPLYFWLTHLWLRLWQMPGELVGLGVARSLSALLGVAGIPMAYGLSYWVMAGARSARRHRVALLTAALMALSPFGVYLAQEARHYTLALLWVMASLGYFVLAWRALRWRSQLPTESPKTVEVSWPVTLLWVGVNGLGLATHYFVGLVLAAEGIALAGLAAVQWRSGVIPGDELGRWRSTVGKIAVVAGGALLAALPWLPFWLSIPGDRLTEWISQDSSLLERLVMPLLRVLAWLASMVMLLPVEQVPVWLAVLSGLGLLAALWWLVPLLVGSLRRLVEQQNPVVEALLAVQGVGLLLVLAAIYLWQKDLSLATRYFFVFLPGMVLLVAMALAGLNQRRLTGLLLALGFAGSLAVTTGHAFQKPDRPDLVVQQILLDVDPSQPQLMLTMEKTHEQLSEMLSLAWEWNQAMEETVPSGAVKPEQLGFLVTRRGADLAENTSKVYEGSVTVPRPFQLWEFNLAEGVAFEVFACEAARDRFYRVGGYRFKHHRCR